MRPDFQARHWDYEDYEEGAATIVEYHGIDDVGVFPGVTRFESDGHCFYYYHDAVTPGIMRGARFLMASPWTSVKEIHAA